MNMKLSHFLSLIYNLFVICTAILKKKIHAWCGLNPVITRSRLMRSEKLNRQCNLTSYEFSINTKQIPRIEVTFNLNVTQIQVHEDNSKTTCSYIYHIRTMAIRYIIIYLYKIAILHHGMQSFHNNRLLHACLLHARLLHGCDVTHISRKGHFSTSISLREHANECRMSRN